MQVVVIVVGFRFHLTPLSLDWTTHLRLLSAITKFTKKIWAIYKTTL
jgi:hypothetical protein